MTKGPDCNNWDTWGPKSHNRDTWRPKSFNWNLDGPKSHNRDTYETKFGQLKLVRLRRQKVKLRLNYIIDPNRPDIRVMWLKSSFQTQKQKAYLLIIFIKLKSFIGDLLSIIVISTFFIIRNRVQSLQIEKLHLFFFRPLIQKQILLLALEWSHLKI